ncbi:MAG: SUMF1/EgtB/PvdO family nonheme iron enzyme [Marinicella sp.]
MTTKTEEHILAVGTEIKEFVIFEILGEGGFGITYLAEDTQLDRKVAIKEYFPTDLSVRARDSKTINPKSSTEENYQFGLIKFLEEAKTLAQFKHPNIVGVNRFIEANNTAYLIMDFEEGEDLSDYLKRTGFKGNMPETELKGYLIPILQGLQAVHEKGLLHRDVKPGNIYLRKGGEPMLIDFGAARYALGEHSKSMSAIISMGYAPPEQYSSKAKQSPASDLYAWGATAYELITGKPPIESPDRSNAIFEDEPDPLKPLSQTHKGKYSSTLLSVIDQCLNIPQKKRPQSAAEVLAMLTGEKQSTGTVKVDAKDRFKSNTVVLAQERHPRPRSGTGTSSRNNRHSDRAQRVEESHHTGSQPKRKSNTIKYAAILLLLTGIGAGSYYGYDYYQEQQKIAEAQRIAAEQEKQRQQQAKLKAERDEQQAWDTAQSTNTIQSYQAYLDQYPKGKNSNEANKQLTQLKAELGNLTAQVQKLLIKLDYQVTTNGTLDARTEAAIKDFEAKHNILVTGKADQVLLNNLQQAYSDQDAKAWQQALKTNSITAYQNYQSNYSDGRYIDQVDSKIASVRQAIADAEAEKQRQAKIAADNQAWQQALNSHTETAYTQYRSTYPNGIHIEKLATQIDKVKQELLQKELIGTIQSELKRLGYKDQSIDGQLGTTTQNRIKAYQKLKKQIQTGEASQSLLTQLKAETKWPGRLPGEIYKDCSDCPEMVIIPAGSFRMGSNEESSEQPIHTVIIKQFAMSTTEVTFAQWDACYKAGGCSHKPNDEGWGRGNRPVINVNWDDAKEYTQWLSQKTGKTYRLPSESEWEYAARAGSSTKYSWGDSISCSQANYGGCGKRSTQPVKSYKKNAFDLYDMHGNVWEWVEDKYYDNYNGAPSDGSAWTNGSSQYRVLRGGSWYNFSNLLRSVYRYRFDPKNRIYDFGFRLSQNTE